MIKVALIIGSTRPNRFADTPARWLLDAAKARSDFTLEALDLRDQGLPLYNEPAPQSYTDGVFVEPAAETWRAKIGSYDAYIATVAEYNHGPSAVLKNAFDSAQLEWRRKPIAFLGYGGVGGARAIEQLRGVSVELQMAPVRHEVNIAMEPFVGMLMHGKTMDDYPYLAQTRDLMFDHLVWWGETLKAGRERVA